MSQAPDGRALESGRQSPFLDRARELPPRELPPQMTAFHPFACTCHG